MKLTRTVTDRPELDESRQPTCYDDRDPIRPWLARIEPLEDFEDMELARSWVKNPPAVTPADAAYAPGHKPVSTPAPELVVPPDVSTLSLPIREQIAARLQAMRSEPVNFPHASPRWGDLNAVLLMGRSDRAEYDQLENAGLAHHGSIYLALHTADWPLDTTLALDKASGTTVGSETPHNAVSTPPEGK